MIRAELADLPVHLAESIRRDKFLYAYSLR